MLQLYDLNNIKLDGLVNYKELKIERGINTDDTLSFLYPNSDVKHDLIQEECYIRTKENEYVVKEINVGDDWTEYVCKINLETIKGNYVAHFETVEQSCPNAVNLALVGTGWTVGSCDVVKLRTVRKNNSTSHVILQEVQSAYNCEMKFDSINKKVYIYQSMGSDKGTYFSEQLNLKKLDVQRNSYDYITRLIPAGKDGLGIASVNGGLNYIENHQYSNKIITAFWEDNRYTDAQSLMEDSIARLSYLSKPYKSYKADIIDLANINPLYTILDYGLGDTITLLSKSKEVKEKQRIIKLTEYPEEPEKNSCEIANKILRLEDLQIKFIESAEVVDSVTTSDGLVDGTKVDSIDWSQLQNVHIVIADIQDLSVVTARIGTLEANSATITQLNATNATILTLTTSKANVTDLTASNARIGTLEVDTASINILLAGNIGAINLAAGAIQAGSAVIANAAINSAQIISLDVVKLNAGNISTNKFVVQSDSGNLKIQDNTIKVWDTNGKERVSLGQNGTDYNLLIRGTDGTTVLFGTDGVTHAGITQGAVDNSNVATNANISGTKLDINSVVSSINGATTTIQGSKIFLNNSTLDIQFTNLSTTVTNQGTTITNQATSITALSDSIALKAAQTSLDSTNEATTALTTRVSTAESKITPTAIVSTVTTSSTYTTAMGLKMTSAQATTIAQTATNIQIGFNAINSAMVTIDATGLHVKGGTISADTIKGGTLTLGGASNGSGVFQAFDSGGVITVTINNLGIALNGSNALTSNYSRIFNGNNLEGHLILKDGVITSQLYDAGFGTINEVEIGFGAVSLNSYQYAAFPLKGAEIGKGTIFLGGEQGDDLIISALSAGGVVSIWSDLATHDIVSSGNITSEGRIIALGGSATGYATSPLEIRTGGTGDANNPRISFHRPGVVASQIGMATNGGIRTYNNPGTGYANFAAQDISAIGGLWVGGVAATTSANVAFAIVKRNSLGYISSGGWISATLINGWYNSGSGYNVFSFMKDALGFVHIRGMITGGPAAGGSGNISTLPDGYRPADTEMSIVASNNFNYSYNLFIQDTGVLSISGSALGVVSYIYIDACFQAA